MLQAELCGGIVRVVLGADDAASFTPFPFRDADGIFLTLARIAFTPRPVWQLTESSAPGETKQTANGEVVSFGSEERKLVRTIHSASLRFTYPGSPILTGLGAHEDGVFDYAGREELLYEHNMKIPIPFLLSSDGWGLLIEAGCAMRFRGEANTFTFDLDAAADTVSFVVIRGMDCADVLRKLAGITGLPAMLPKWVFGYIQSRERYRSAEEVLSVAREFRRRGLGLDCIVQDWLTWQDGCWGDKTPDPARFSDIRALTDALHQMDIHFMVSVWPNTGSGRDCDEFARAGLFLPSSRIYDAFSPEARDLYWQQCRRYWMDGGTDALWCDSCERSPIRTGAEKKSAIRRPDTA